MRRFRNSTLVVECGASRLEKLSRSSELARRSCLSWGCGCRTKLLTRPEEGDLWQADHVRACNCVRVCVCVVVVVGG